MRDTKIDKIWINDPKWSWTGVPLYQCYVIRVTSTIRYSLRTHPDLHLNDDDGNCITEENLSYVDFISSYDMDQEWRSRRSIYLTEEEFTYWKLHDYLIEIDDQNESRLLDKKIMAGYTYLTGI